MAILVVHCSNKAQQSVFYGAVDACVPESCIRRRGAYIAKVSAFIRQGWMRCNQFPSKQDVAGQAHSDFGLDPDFLHFSQGAWRKERLHEKVSVITLRWIKFPVFLFH